MNEVSFQLIAELMAAWANRLVHGMGLDARLVMQWREDYPKFIVEDKELINRRFEENG